MHQRRRGGFFGINSGASHHGPVASSSQLPGAFVGRSPQVPVAKESWQQSGLYSVLLVL